MFGTSLGWNKLEASPVYFNSCRFKSASSGHAVTAFTEEPLRAGQLPISSIQPFSDFSRPRTIVNKTPKRTLSALFITLRNVGLFHQKPRQKPASGSEPVPVPKSFVPSAMTKVSWKSCFEMAREKLLDVIKPLLDIRNAEERKTLNLSEPRDLHIMQHRGLCNRCYVRWTAAEYKRKSAAS
jgi:hypothetical protein